MSPGAFPVPADPGVLPVPGVLLPVPGVFLVPSDPGVLPVQVSLSLSPDALPVPGVFPVPADPGVLLPVQVCLSLSQVCLSLSPVCSLSQVRCYLSQVCLSLTRVCYLSQVCLSLTQVRCYLSQVCFTCLRCALPVSGARVALKLLSKERTARCGFLREFCTHLCLRGGLTCVQVLPLAFETPTEFGFAQELAPAGDLCVSPIPRGLPEPQVKRCAAQVSSALSYLHGHALVHRDLKLDNVLAFDRECHLVKLGDFGLTRVLGWQVRPARSPAPYAAPELWHLRAGEARLRLEPALDTWAFGVLLFALLTGRFPWSSPARSDPAFRRFRTWHGRTCAGEAPPRPPRTWRGLGEAALRMLRGLLHPLPGRRCPPGEVLRYLGEGNTWRWDRNTWTGEMETPGDGIETPGNGRETPGQVRETPGDGLGTSGMSWKHLDRSWTHLEGAKNTWTGVGHTWMEP
uniref:Protein kinase domain-containing protein n=1 Tax=Catharus ustulatus TaxID=91951 RepID=A0A8C3Y5W2_CATUS